ncbi:MAG: chorismate mutase [Gammaproteobacteria bacterium]|nr:chorismate mutase [Gammaproteobacteria bacterium]
MTQIRSQIDALDAAMVRLMGKRMHLSRQALALKAGQGMALHSPEREQEILERTASLAQHNGLDAALVRNMFLLLLRQYVEPGDNAIVLPLARPK